MDLIFRFIFYILGAIALAEILFISYKLKKGRIDMKTYASKIFLILVSLTVLLLTYWRLQHVS